MSKNVAVFVDVANIFYAAKAAGVDIDYVTLLKAAIAGRDFVRAYAYTGLDPENENQRQFHSFLARNSYKVVSKDIRKYGDGRIKANLDIELVVDMMKLSRNLDVAVVISGDGDFAPAIRAVQEMGVRVEVISFRGNTSSDLIEAADVFTDIVQLARVDTGSSRSGRRVAAEGDLSMTEVPDKETEGLARRRRGGASRRGERTADRTGEGRTAVLRERERVAAPVELRNGHPSEGEPVGLPGNLIVLPGEKLSRAGRAAAGSSSDIERTAFDDVQDVDELDDAATAAYEAAAERGEIPVIVGDQTGDDGTGDGRRRRRRRGGRGRGRGRSGEQEFAAEAPLDLVSRIESAPDGAAVSGEALDAEALDAEALEDEEMDEPQAIRLPQHSTFGSVWDSQLGVPTQPILPTGALGEDEFEDEPEIPEYLLAERQRGQAQRGRGAPNRMGGRMGGRNAGYQSAVDRERYGRAGVPTTGSSFGGPRRDDRSGMPASGSSFGGPRRDDRGGRTGPRQDRDRQGGRVQGQGSQGQRPPRSDRPRDDRPPQREQRVTPSGDPWTEVPPELEELLREELARKSGAHPPARSRGTDEVGTGASEEGSLVPTSGTGASENGSLDPTSVTAASGRSRGTRARGTGTRRTASVAETASTGTGSSGSGEAGPESVAVTDGGAATKPRRTTTTRRRATGAAVDVPTAEPASADGSLEADVAATAAGDPPTASAPKPRPRARRTSTAVMAQGASATEANGGPRTQDVADAPAAPKRRAPRKASGADPAGSASSTAGTAVAVDPAPAAGAEAAPKRRTRKTAEALPAES